MFNNSNFFINEDRSTTVRYPDTIKVQEHKAPTDESIRLMEEIQEKVLKNLIAKIHIKGDNNINGQCYVFQSLHEFELAYNVVCKFKLNGVDFSTKHVFTYSDVNNDPDFKDIESYFHNVGYSVILYYTLKHFAHIMFQQIKKHGVPSWLDAPYVSQRIDGTR